MQILNREAMSRSQPRQGMYSVQNICQTGTCSRPLTMPRLINHCRTTVCGTRFFPHKPRWFLKCTMLPCPCGSNLARHDLVISPLQSHFSVGCIPSLCSFAPLCASVCLNPSLSPNFSWLKHAKTIVLLFSSDHCWSTSFVSRWVHPDLICHRGFLVS